MYVSSVELLLLVRNREHISRRKIIFVYKMWKYVTFLFAYSVFYKEFLKEKKKMVWMSSRLEQSAATGTVDAVLATLAAGDAADVLTSGLALVLGTFCEKTWKRKKENYSLRINNLLMNYSLNHRKSKLYSCILIYIYSIIILTRLCTGEEQHGNDEQPQVLQEVHFLDFLKKWLITTQLYLYTQ